MAKYLIAKCPECKQHYILPTSTVCFLTNRDISLVTINEKDWISVELDRDVRKEEIETEGPNWAKNEPYMDFSKWLIFIIPACLFFALTQGGIIVILGLIAFTIYGLSRQSEHHNTYVAGDNKYRNDIEVILKNERKLEEQQPERIKFLKTQREYELLTRTQEDTCKGLIFIQKRLKHYNIKWNKDLHNFEFPERKPLEIGINSPLFNNYMYNHQSKELVGLEYQISMIQMHFTPKETYDIFHGTVAPKSNTDNTPWIYKPNGEALNDLDMAVVRNNLNFHVVKPAMLPNQ